MSKCSNNEDNLANKFYKHSTEVVTEQIHSTTKTNPTPSGFEFSKLTKNVEALTSQMKEVLKNESSRPILGRSECDDSEKELNKADKSVINHSLRKNLVETDPVNVTIKQSNSDPLHSVKSFDDLRLKSELLNGISSMGFRKPSSIQEKALPMLLENQPKNLIAQSQSGTGKTATFLLTVLSKIDVNDPFCQCLCMAPTRELVMQIAEVAKIMSKFMNKVNITCAVKGQSPAILDGQINSQVIIGTPGTLKFWTTDNSALYFNPKKLKVFVLDEADILIETPEFLNIAKRIKSKVTNNCQILLFSATYDERVMDFAHDFVPNPTEFSIRPQELTLKNIKQYFIRMNSAEEKYPKLIDIYGMKSMGQCIIFCESRNMASYLQKALERDSHISSLLTGFLDVIDRQQQIDDFRNGKSRVLIATNLCSRGIDIPQVNLIINWDMPKTKDGKPDCETYLHRIGRSGRFGKTGLTINFIVTDDDMLIQQKIVDVYGAKIEEMTNLEIVASL